VLYSTKGVGIRVYQESLEMAPSEMLCSCRCRTPLFWSETREQKFLDLTYCRKPRNELVRWEKTCRLHSWCRRAMLTIGEEKWVLKLETTYTSRSYLWEVYDVSSYDANSRLSSLDWSRSWRREKSIECIISKFLFRPVWISEARFILRGYVCETPKFSILECDEYSLNFKTFYQ
jgi:hypothetical protein